MNFLIEITMPLLVVDNWRNCRWKGNNEGSTEVRTLANTFLAVLWVIIRGVLCDVTAKTSELGLVGR